MDAGVDDAGREKAVGLVTLIGRIRCGDARSNADPPRILLRKVFLMSEATAKIIDVRQLPPAQRHSTIFQSYTALKGGEAFELVNDHDPKPLYYQFDAEHKGQFTWDYKEQGPQVWRVRIGKPD
jgi:uncharacterized protein (DUF2249 family)